MSTNRKPRESRWQCLSCQEISLDSELLRAQNPFDADDEICGCPYCKSVEGFSEICEFCDSHATCGTPTKEGFFDNVNPDGYVRTCGKHKPEEKP